jgi:hypothetical protein
MPKPGADLVVTQKHRRAFSQRGGPSPVNITRYAGANETYMVFEDDTNPITGGRSPINFHDPLRRARPAEHDDQLHGAPRRHSVERLRRRLLS